MMSEQRAHRGYWYLASPYSFHPDGPEVAFREACEAAALLINAGVPVFSPIVHSHLIAIAGNIDPLSHEIWLSADRPLLDAAAGLIVLHLRGWDLSRGVAEERRLCAAAGKPEVHMLPGLLPPQWTAGP
jgi:hypothetical protein